MDHVAPLNFFRSHTLGYQYHPPGFAAWSNPTYAVISGGERDRLETVATAYASRGSHVLHTAERGAVRVSIRGEELAVDCWHDDARRILELSR